MSLAPTWPCQTSPSTLCILTKSTPASRCHRKPVYRVLCSPRVALHRPRLSSPHVVPGQATLKPSPPNLCRARGARPRGRWYLPQLMLEQAKLEHASRPRRPHPPRLRESPLERGNDGVKEGRGPSTCFEARVRLFSHLRRVFAWGVPPCKRH
jgi:hypothetical protein